MHGPVNVKKVAVVIACPIQCSKRERSNEDGRWIWIFSIRSATTDFTLCTPPHPRPTLMGGP